MVVLLVGKGVPEPKDDINKALNNLNDTLDACIDSVTTKKKSIWERIFG